MNKYKGCLKCNHARCTQACPIDTPIAEVMKLVENNEIVKAKVLLFENNPFSAACAYICDHRKQCYGNCVLNAKNEPFPFYQVEKELSSAFLKEVKLDQLKDNDKNIAIIGGGPAGMSAALMLRQHGCSVTIFESHERIGGVLRYGIPNSRLPQEIMDNLERLCIESGILIRPNIVVGPIITLDNLLEDGYDAVFVSTGVWNPRKLNIKGETLGHVHYAIDFLKSPQTCHLKDKVIVVGAGNVAMDAARTAKMLGKDVSVYYRKSFNEMTASIDELNDAKNEGVKFELFQTPIEIRIDGVVFINCENEVHENGRISSKEIKGTEHFVPCDNVIIAISQTPKDNLIKTSSDLVINRWGCIEVDEFGNTSKKGVFAAGDVVNGSKTAVHTVADTKIVVKTILNSLQIEDKGFKVVKNEEEVK